jgi:hypothetical protein
MSGGALSLEADHPVLPDTLANPERLQPSGISTAGACLPRSPPGQQKGDTRTEHEQSNASPTLSVLYLQNMSLSSQ